MLIIKDFAENTFLVFGQLRQRSPDSKLLESALFTFSNYSKHLLQSSISSYHEDRTSLEETLSVLRYKFAMWPSSVEYRPFLTLAQLDKNSVLDLTLIPTVQWLVEEDVVISSDTSTELR